MRAKAPYTTAEGRARLALDDPQTPDRVRAALAAGAVQHLTVDAPSLEDVFLKLTGEALDAEAPDGHQTPDREAPDHA